MSGDRIHDAMQPEWLRWAAKAAAAPATNAPMIASPGGWSRRQQHAYAQLKAGGLCLSALKVADG